MILLRTISHSSLARTNLIHPLFSFIHRWCEPLWNNANTIWPCDQEKTLSSSSDYWIVVRGRPVLFWLYMLVNFITNPLNRPIGENRTTWRNAGRSPRRGVHHSRMLRQWRYRRVMSRTIISAPRRCPIVGCRQPTASRSLLKRGSISLR